jgi:hypothetical protein
MESPARDDVWYTSVQRGYACSAHSVAFVVRMFERGDTQAAMFGSVDGKCMVTYIAMITAHMRSRLDDLLVLFAGSA